MSRPRATVGPGVGRTGFVARHGLWTAEQAEAGAELAGRIDNGEVETLRFSFADQHGIARGKALIGEAAKAALASGVSLPSTLLTKDTSHATVFPAFSKGSGLGLNELTGASDIVLVADPATFVMLPWAPRTGWVLCDVYFTNGRPAPFSGRRILRQVLEPLASEGRRLITGLEIEFHLFRLENPHLAPEDATQPATAPEVSLLARGFHYLTETRLDELEQGIELLRDGLLAMGVPLRSAECEFGPSQVEFTFAADEAVASADRMILFRTAAKQICRRNGLHVTFMCKPGLPNLFASGWHLHQSVADAGGNNVFAPDDEGDLLSPYGRQWVAGLIDNAAASALLTTPTVNGYKRYRPNSLAPDRAAWSKDNRGVMLRVIGAGPGDPATRIENRIGDPAANPYFYMASQALAGLDGVARGLAPPSPTETPYEEADAPALPQSLMEAVPAFRNSALYREKLGDLFVDYWADMKQAEIARFLSSVTDWEQREYFEIY